MIDEQLEEWAEEEEEEQEEEDESTLDVVFPRLSENAQDAMSRANSFRLGQHQSKIHMEHLLVGLFDAEKSVARRRLEEAGLNRKALAKLLKGQRSLHTPQPTPYPPSDLGSQPAVKSASGSKSSGPLWPELSSHVAQAVAFAESLTGGSGTIFSEHLLAGFVSVEQCTVVRVLREALNPEEFRRLGWEEPQESVQIATAGDQAAIEDKLGFRPYVEAIADFLLSESTQPPLTLSIEGDWGSGKTSFMKQLEGEIHRRNKMSDRYHSTIWFNAWRHDDQESLWAAFALEFQRKIGAQRIFLYRWWGHLRLLWSRFRWRDGWLPALRSAGAWSAFLAMVALSFWLGTDYVFDNLDRMDQPVSLLVGGSGLGVLLTFFAGAWLKVKQWFGNPLDAQLRHYLDAPDYASQVASIEQFHQDFSKIVEAYTGKHGKVFIFIDDLDRCDIPRAADLMEALNLLIADDPRLVFLLGMDREKVAAGLAIKFEKLLPYLTDGYAQNGRPEGGDLDGEAKRRAGLAFGYSFIEKFVQLPFRLPKPRMEKLEEWLDSFSKPSKATEASDDPGSGSEPGDQRDATEPLTMSSKGEEGVSTKDAKQNRPRLLNPDLETDSKAVQKAVLAVAKPVRPNPRQFKQLVNLFRLRAYIADATGDLAELELEQLAKLVTLELLWPALMEDLLKNRQSLPQLEKEARSSDESDVADPRLWALLREGMTLESVNLDLLKRVSSTRSTASP